MKRMITDQELEKPVHGYIHGHIHRHKDHTHIHGHIHSHKNGVNEVDTVEEDFVPDCPLDTLPLCEDVFCGELDDCFYINCDDSEPSNCCDENYDSICRDKNCNNSDNSGSEIENEINTFIDYHNNETICEDPKCLENQDATVCCYNEEHLQNHLNNLCDDSNNKEFFDKMFQELHKDFDLYSGAVNSSAIRTANTSIFGSAVNEVHYPHEAHPLNNIHNAFFHAKVDDNKTENSLEMDFDFRFDFSNKPKNIGMDTMLDATPTLGTTVPVDTAPIDDSPNFRLSPNSNGQITCEWDNCNKVIDNDNFLSHLSQEHLCQEASKDYPCEWSNCNHLDSNLDSLLLHLNSHKRKPTNDVLILTPASNYSGSASIKSQDSEIKFLQNEDSINITNLQFRPQKKQTTDDNFTCCWEIGTDEMGNFIKCNKTHKDQGELQAHITEDHIKKRQKTYECKWIDCRRHNGKIFTQRQKLIRHLHTHTNYKPWKCNICNMCFAVKQTLDQHQRIHSGEKPFKCSCCDKRFSSSSSLSIHSRVHTGFKPLSCKICGKQFNELSNFNKHFRTHFPTLLNQSQAPGKAYIQSKIVK